VTALLAALQTAHARIPFDEGSNCEPCATCDECDICMGPCLAQCTFMCDGCKDNGEGGDCYGDSSNSTYCKKNCSPACAHCDKCAECPGKCENCKSDLCTSQECSLKYVIEEHCGNGNQCGPHCLKVCQPCLTCARCGQCKQFCGDCMYCSDPHRDIKKSNGCDTDSCKGACKACTGCQACSLRPDSMCAPCEVCVWTGNERFYDDWDSDTELNERTQAERAKAQAMDNWVDAMMSMPFDPADEVVVDMGAYDADPSSSSPSGVRVEPMFLSAVAMVGVAAIVGAWYRSKTQRSEVQEVLAGEVVKAKYGAIPGTPQVTPRNEGEQL